MDIETGTPNTVSVSRFNFNFTSIPRLSRWLILFIVALYLSTLPFSTNAIDLLALIPSNFIPPHTFLWTAVTAGFYHRPQEIGELIINVAVILLVTPSLDPIWGGKEIFKFILLVNTACCLASFVVRIIIFFFTNHLAIMFSPVSGFLGASMGLLVALKQINPEKEWSLSRASIRAKHLPFICLILSLVHTIFRSSNNFEFAFVGLLTSWTYLRYFQHIGVKGDLSSQFKFSTLFPELIQPIIELIIRIICCCVPKRKAASTNVLGDDFTNYSLLSSPEDADRRRKLALKALDDKFQNMKDLPLQTKGEEPQKHQDTSQPETVNSSIYPNLELNK